MVIGTMTIRRRELLTVAGAFSLLTLIFTYPLSTRAASVMLDDQPDFHLFIWNLAWLAHIWATDPLSTFDANIFYPLNTTLAFSENLIGSGFIAAPVIWLTGNHVLATNLVSLMSVFLCGLGAYVLGRALGMGPPAAFVCGIVFAFCPPRFFRLGQTHLTTVQWIPFALAYMHGYFSAGRPRDVRVAAAFFTLQALTSGHGAVYLALSIAGLFVYRVAAGDAIAPVRRLRDLGLTGALLLVPAVLLFLPYHLVRQEMGLRRVFETTPFPAISFLASPSTVHQAILSQFVPLSHVADTAHAYLFPGYLPPVLALMALVLAGRRIVSHRAADHTLFYALLAILTIWLSIGPPFGLWRFVYWLPGLNFIRVPSRFMILTVLTLAVLAGIAVERLQKRVRVAPLTLASALGLVMLVEFSTIPIKVTPFTTRPSAAERWLADQPKPFVVAEVPVFGVARDQSTYMLHSVNHWQKTVHGYSGIEPPDHMRLYTTMRRFPDAESLAAMRSFGVTHVVLHIDRYRPGDWERVAPRLSAVETELEVVFQDLRSRVYRFRAQ